MPFDHGDIHHDSNGRFSYDNREKEISQELVWPFSSLESTPKIIIDWSKLPIYDEYPKGVTYADTRLSHMNTSEVVIKIRMITTTMNELKTLLANEFHAPWSILALYQLTVYYLPRCEFLQYDKLDPSLKRIF